MTVKNAFYAQSGGVTAVINATACGLIQEARRHPDRIGKVFAGRDGIIGALTENLIDTASNPTRISPACARRRVAPSVPAATN
jgi:6-phosphofructokinase